MDNRLTVKIKPANRLDCEIHDVCPQKLTCEMVGHLSVKIEPLEKFLHSAVQIY